MANRSCAVADTAQHKRFLLVIGLLIGVQSLCLYFAVARLPVALALLAFNTYPLWTALRDRLLYQRRPQRAQLQAMPVILVGLALALTQHETTGIDGRMRTASTMMLTGLVALTVVGAARRHAFARRHCRLIGLGRTDVVVWHGFHRHVYRAAQAGRGG